MLYEKGKNNVVRTHCSVKNSVHKYKLKGVSAMVLPLEWPKDLQKYDLYINKEKLRELVLPSQQPQVALLAKKLGINVNKLKYMSKENNSIEIIMEKRWLDSFISIYCKALEYKKNTSDTRAL